MNKTKLLILGAAAGVGVIYFYDPQRGPDRRQSLLDQLARLTAGWPRRVSQAVSAAATTEPIEVRLTTEFRVSLQETFAFFAKPENYLWLSDMVTDISNHGDGSFTKDMLIAGVPVRFAERFVQVEPNVLLETESEPESMLEYAKSMWFEEVNDRHTRVHLKFTYQPPAGIVGHTVAEFAGIDPKSILEELMMAAKKHLHGKQDQAGADRDADRGEELNARTYQPRPRDTNADDYDIDGPRERVMSPDDLDRAFTSDGERASHDDRDLHGESMAAQTDEDGQNFIENIQTAVTDSPSPEELRAADDEPTALELDHPPAHPQVLRKRNPR